MNQKSRNYLILNDRNFSRMN